MIDYDPFAAALARWIDARLTFEQCTARSEPARLIGISVLDTAGVIDGAEGALRFVAVAEGEPYELAGSVAAVAIAHHDAIALVTEGWGAPLPEDGAAEPSPSRHPDRRRVRVVTVALDSGAVACALRWTGSAGTAVDPGQVLGPLAEVLSDACCVAASDPARPDLPERDRWSAA